MAQMGFYFDQRICSGCRCCQIACKDAKNLEVGHFFRKVTDYEGGTFPNMWAASLSIACNHCETPACITSCAVSAISKDGVDGLVTIDESLCIGCQTCVTACPYTHPSYNAETNLVTKCDGCLNFLEVDEKPACVAACSTRALDFGDIAELEEKYGANEMVKDLSVLPDSSMTNPSVLIVPKPEMV